MTAVRTAAAGLALLLAAACTAPTPPRSQASAAAGTACARPSGSLGAETPTTVDVIEQAYFCILDRYHAGAVLDARSLLAAGFLALTQELNRNGRDVPEAIMPALTGDRKADWAAFETAYRKVTDRVPDLRDKLAVTTLEAIVAALGDDHARWAHDAGRPPDSYDVDGYGLGLQVSVTSLQAGGDPGAAIPAVRHRRAGRRRAGRRAAPRRHHRSRQRLGALHRRQGHPAVAALYPDYPEARPVELRLLRQATGRRWSVTLTPGLFPQDPAALRVVQSKLLEDDVAYVRLRGFASDAANRVFKAIARLRTGRTLSGVVLDLRDNGGGSPAETTRLLSAFGHGKVTAYQCTVDGECEAMRTDDTVELLGLPLVVLIGPGCPSACEHFSAAVKDLRLGQLVGTRTAGAVSGPASSYLLSNNTLLGFPSKHHLGPNREVIDRIGVPPDHHVPPTAEDAAAGRDPALAKALTLLHK
nr:hypothetical protein GCM10020093_003950 [Planobispora longispora]